jgi:hypothetical protein
MSAALFDVMSRYVGRYIATLIPPDATDTIAADDNRAQSVAVRGVERRSLRNGEEILVATAKHGSVMV